MSRAEMLEKRAKDRERASRRGKAAATVQLTIYQFPLPVPGPPGKEAPTPAFEITREPGALPSAAPSVRDEPSVISSSAAGVTNARPFASPFAATPDDETNERED